MSGGAPFAGPMQQGPEATKNLTNALSCIALANICFKQCIIKQEGGMPQRKEKATSTDESSLSDKTKLVIDRLGIAHDPESSEGWSLSERETVCVHNCTKSYIELKDFLHT